MENLRYCFLHIGNDRSDVRLAGYRFPLTFTEYRILRIITEHTVAQDGGATVDTIFSSLGDRDIQRGNVPVHICSLNKKARSISGRKLVLYEHGHYYLNDCM